MNSKRIFITGIAGFIGFHVAQFLKQQNHFIIGCDNFNDYYDPTLKRMRAKQLEACGIVVEEADICDTAFVQKQLSEKGITHLLHFAAQAGVRYSIQRPEKYVHSNINGFLSILETLKKYPHVKLVYASSSSVYGLNSKVPFSEKDPINQPANFYAATKISNEAMAYAYHHLYGISAIGLRYFTVYGPWGRPDMAYFTFTRAIMEGRPIQLHNFGQMQRDFTYIEDIVKGTVAALDLEPGCEIFNLGNSKPEPLAHLISLIERKTGKQAIKQGIPMQAGELTITYADISKSREKLGFLPMTPLEEGMGKFIDWYYTISEK